MLPVVKVGEVLEKERDQLKSLLPSVCFRYYYYQNKLSNWERGFIIARCTHSVGEMRGEVVRLLRDYSLKVDFMVKVLMKSKIFP
jgi:hypothetical protein